MKLILLVIALCLPALSATPDRVKVATGTLEGTGPQTSGVRVFKGIPFARPPVGNLRWTAPEPPANWKGSRQATEFGPRCMQQPLYADMNFRSNGVSEDCLYLNVWTPAKSASAKLPVMVYFFGGGFMAGDGSEPRYDGESLASKGLIAITVNYRLGAFGLLAHPSLTAESSHHASGNYGFLDQSMALQWVKQNIAAFGGDPNHITIAGESAGSISVSAQMASPLSKDLIVGAIGESGSILASLAPLSLSKGEEQGVVFASALGVSTLSDLRVLSAERILEEAGKRGTPRFTPVIDGYFFPDWPLAIFSAGKQAHVPLLAGWNSEEMNARAVLGTDPATPENFRKAVARLYPEHASEVLKEYATADSSEALQSATALAGDRFIAYGTWKWIDLAAKTGGKPVYRYYYSRARPATKPDSPQGAVHSSEIEYALGNLNGNRTYAWTADDYKVSVLMEGLFVNFIKTGNPNAAGQLIWPTATNGDPSWLLHIDVVTRAETATDSGRYAVLDRLAAPPSDSTNDAKFKAIYTKEWAWRQSQRGEEDEDSAGSRRGIPPQMPKVDLAMQDARLAYWTGVMKQLDGIDSRSLSAPEQINYAVYRAQIDVLIQNQKFRDFEMPANSDTAFWSSIAGTARRPFRNARDYENYLSQLTDLPRYFDEETVNMKAGLKRGFTAPLVTMNGREATIVSVTEAKSPQDTVFYTPFKKMPASIPADDQAAMRAKAAKLIGESVIPAHLKLLKFVRNEYLPGLRTGLAAESLPDGKAYYQEKILEFTTTKMTPDQIHQIGLSEMANIHAEMLDVIKQTNFTGDFPAFLKFLRTDPRFYAKTPEELLMRSAYVAKEFDGKASQYFGYLPRMRFAITPVPMDQAPFYTSARGGPGTYWVNTYDLPSRALYSMPALTLHESAPGHSFQMPIALEHKDLPAFRRAYISAYGEGWALYCERLGTEMGMYHTPYEVFGMLSYQAWRASRLVVDTGIHAKGWTREQAQKYLSDNTALSEHEIETEVDRYISWPAQALSYYLGEMEIVKGRRKAEAALGPKFNIRAFHDTVLELGAVPLPVLAARIDRFIAEGGKGPYPEME